jgi:hypothetical protein
MIQISLKMECLEQEMPPTIERILPLISMGYLPWSFAIIYLIIGVVRYRMSKAKPELVLVGLSFVAIIAVGVLARSSSSGGTRTEVRSGNITQQGTQNAAGVGGSVAQIPGPCDNSSAVRK